MTGATHWIGTACVCFGTLSWLLIVLFYFAKPEQRGRLALVRHLSQLERKLRFLRHFYPPSRILWIQLVLGVASLVLAAAMSNALFLLALPIIILAPSVHLERSVAKRVARLEEQTEPWLNAIANALKASPSLGEAIASSASLVPVPMSEEIDLMIKEYELGTALDRALEQFAERVGSRVLSGAVLALQVARQSGGNLPEALESAAAALRELARLEGVVRTKTAEGKAQSFVIGAIPVPMVLAIHQMDRHFFEPLIRTFTGHLVIAVAVVLWISAILLSMKILSVDI